MAKKKTPKPKKKPVVEVAEDDDFEPVTKPKKRSSEDDEDDGRPKVRNDVYFGLTLITTLILIGAAVLLYFDQEDLKDGPNAGFNPPEIKAGPLGGRPPAGKQ